MGPTTIREAQLGRVGDHRFQCTASYWPVPYYRADRLTRGNSYLAATSTRSRFEVSLVFKLPKRPCLMGTKLQKGMANSGKGRLQSTDWCRTVAHTQKATTNSWQPFCGPHYAVQSRACKDFLQDLVDHEINIHWTPGVQIPLYRPTLIGLS